MYGTVTPIRIDVRAMGLIASRRREVINLNFHGIGTPTRSLEPGEDQYWIDRESFLAILDELRDRSDVRLSFDDGNASDVDIALPALAERGMEADFFIVAGRLGEPGSVDSEGVRALLGQHMTVGTHGMNHLSWRGLSNSDRRVEMEDARHVIAEASGVPVDIAALPFGQYDRRVLATLRGLEYRFVYSSDARRARAGAWFQPRYTVRAWDTPRSIQGSVLAVQRAHERLRAQMVGFAKRWR
jgi:peptidoglycan/xylan/chitin deacetylase (PgdA/CDA1 family)